MRRLAQILRDQFVLRGKVPVERHLIGAGCFRDRIDPDRPDSVPIKELACGHKDARAGRNSAVIIMGYGGLAGHFGFPLDTGVTGQ
jgi:hypothetical protein